VADDGLPPESRSLGALTIQEKYRSAEGKNSSADRTARIANGVIGCEQNQNTRAVVLAIPAA
jgi:hypothetical protein